MAIVGGLIMSQAADAVHHAGDLSGLRPARCACAGACARISGPVRPAPVRARAAMNLSRPSSERPMATTLLTVGVALAGALPTCTCRSRPCRRSISRPSRSRRRCRAPIPRPWRPASPTPLEKYLGHIADVTEMTSQQLDRPSPHHAAIRSGPRYQRRGARRAGGDQRRARRPSDDACAATPPTAR